MLALADDFDMLQEMSITTGGADAQNPFNSATVLQRQLDARLTAYNNILEVMNPRMPGSACASSSDPA